MSPLKLAALVAGRAAGAFHLVRNSRWRASRLLILAYHGVSLHDEHEWNPELYMPLDCFERRLRMLASGAYAVLPFAEAVDLLEAGKLPQRAVTLTFDDGMYDFHARAFPLLRSYGFPATVYLTTYYCEFNRPIHNLLGSYLLWKARGRRVDPSSLTGRGTVWDLATPQGRRDAWQGIVESFRRDRLKAADKDAFLTRLAATLGIDDGPIRARRMFHLMGPGEISNLAKQGVTFQLHTHRHRLPGDRPAFQRELIENRECIERLTSTTPTHFCYPSGGYRKDVIQWLAQDGVATATTCDPGLATPRSPRLLLPRFVDTMKQPPVVFEGWLTGAASLLPRRRSYGESH